MSETPRTINNDVHDDLINLELTCLRNRRSSTGKTQGMSLTADFLMSTKAAEEWFKNGLIYLMF